MDRFPYVVTALFQKAVDVVFIVLSLSIQQLIYFHKCCHCSFFKQWMWFSRFYYLFLLKRSGYCFPYVVIAHLISSGLIFILCQCWFTCQCLWFSTCFHCFLSKSSGCSFLCIIPTLLIRMGWICICLHYCIVTNTPRIVLFFKNK